MTDLTKSPPFGMLTVISLAPEQTGKNRKWLCRCACGNEVAVYGFSLKRGTSRSCGCSHHAFDVKSLLNKRFDKVLVLSRAANQGKHVRFNCRCDCGTEVLIYRKRLLRESRIHCGCDRVSQPRQLPKPGAPLDPMRPMKARRSITSNPNDPPHISRTKEQVQADRERGVALRAERSKAKLKRHELAGVRLFKRGERANKSGFTGTKKSPDPGYQLESWNTPRAQENDTLSSYMPYDELPRDMLVSKPYNLSPEKRSLMAALENAIDCLTSRKEYDRLEAEWWVMVGKEDWTFSLENICHALGWDPGYIRKGLQKKYDLREGVEEPIMPEYARGDNQARGWEADVIEELSFDFGEGDGESTGNRLAG